MNSAEKDEEEEEKNEPEEKEEKEKTGTQDGAAESSPASVRTSTLYLFIYLLYI